MKRLVTASAGSETEKNVEDTWVNAMHFAGAKVAQEVVHQGELRRRIATLVIGTVQGLSRVGMNEGKRSAFRRSCPSGDGRSGEHYRAGPAEKCSTTCRKALGPERVVRHA